MAEISFVEVVDVGPGWNKVRASDGNVYTLKGNYNWRSNNPGNIEYGDFAKSMGAIGSGKPPAGRKRGFAIFPTYEAGMKAQETLQFESPRYRDLTIRDAISRYAPEFENDSAAYAAQLAAAAGVTTDTKLSDLTPQQRHAYLQAQHRVEGFVPGRISGEDGKPVPASVARQFAAVPLPPKDIPGGSSASVDTSTPSGIRGLQTQLKRMGIDPGPVDGIMGPRTKAAVKEFQQQNGLAVDGIVGPQTSAVLAASGGSASPNRVPATVAPYLSNRTPPPPPRPRPSLPTPIADAANITPLTFPVPPVASMSRGIVDSTRSPTLFAEGVGIPNDQIPGTDATYSGANRMSTGGLGALLGNSFSPATPNPTPWQPTVAGRPSVPGSLPAARPQTTIAGRPDAPVGSMPAAAWQPTVAGRPEVPGQLPSARTSAPTPAPWGQRPGTSSQAGPMEVAAPTIKATPEYITKTIQVTNPDYYKAINTANPTMAAMGFSPGTMPTVPKTIPKQVTVRNPAYQAPIPATQSAAMAASRVPYTGGDGGLFGVPMSRDMAASQNRSSGSSSQPRSTTRVTNSSGTGAFGTSSSGRRYNADTNRWETV